MFRITSIALLTGLILGGCAARQKVATHDRSGAREPISPDAGDLDVPLPCPVDPAEVMFGPVPWAADRGALRWGWGETELTKVQSSMARPIEVCGVRGQLSWLLALSCEDGSHPFPSGDVAHGARVGSMGAGGRCGTIIDAYSVPCPEGAYEIYMDLYHCVEGEDFM